jgi:NAD(P)-dependent dehydrogenase (short-subunit alcohol dehydrogenase family)
MGALEGKVAIVTGAGGGIGRAHALRLAREGARVVVNDVGGDRHGVGKSVGPAQEVVDEVLAQGGRAIAHVGSVSEPGDVSGLVELAVKTYGRLDIMVNNAGILRDRTLRKMTLEEFDQVIAVHLRGTFLGTQAAGLRMLEQNEGGRIINTSSLSGLIGNFGQANYGAAKAGIYGLTRVAHLEWFAKHKITVNAIAPVAVTRMTEDLTWVNKDEDSKDDLAPEYIADVCAYLASDKAAEISGMVFGVEGNRVFEYKMCEAPKITPKEGGHWSIDELAARVDELRVR